MKHIVPAFILLVALLQSAYMLLVGRPGWCACGQWSLWSSDILSSHNSQHLLDAYSFSHVQHGMLFFAFLFLLGVRPGVGICIAALIEAGWELLENSALIIERYRAATISLGYFGDSLGNSLGDLFCCLLGFIIAARISWKLTLTAYVLIEVAMLLVVRDSLTINVLMLISPMEAIKQWQSGGAS